MIATCWWTCFWNFRRDIAQLPTGFGGELPIFSGVNCPVWPSSLVHSTAECAPVWCRSAHTRLIDFAINDVLWSVTGCLRPTTADNLPVLIGIQLVEFPGKGATLSLHAVPRSLDICSTQRSPVHRVRVRMHGVSNRDTHLYQPHNSSLAHLTTACVRCSGRITAEGGVVGQHYGTPCCHPGHRHPPSWNDPPENSVASV